VEACSALLSRRGPGAPLPLRRPLLPPPARSFMNEERPELEPDDAQFHLDLYRNAPEKTHSITSKSSARETSSSCATCRKERGSQGHPQGGR
jgi:hypothetical protein